MAIFETTLGHKCCLAATKLPGEKPNLDLFGSPNKWQPNAIKPEKQIVAFVKRNTPAMNNRTLLLILVILLAVYGLSRIFSGRQERSFRSELIQVDTSQVTSIVIVPQAGPDAAEIVLKRENSGWIASRQEQNTRALPDAVDRLLAGLSNIKTRRIAAKSPERWPEYEVGDGQGIRVRVFEEGDLREDFIIGRFAFNQQNQTATSFLRLAGQDEVYAVDGFLGMSFSPDFDTYRNKTLLRMQRMMEVTGFSYEQPDTTLQFSKKETGWTLNGERALDSMAVENYLNVLRHLTGETFADDFDELQAPQFETQRLTINATNRTEPFIVTIYRDSTRTLPFVIHSSQNPETYFASDSTGLYRQLFQPAAAFFPME